MQILQLAHAYVHRLHAASNTQHCTAALASASLSASASASSSSTTLRTSCSQQQRKLSYLVVSCRLLTLSYSPSLSRVHIARGCVCAACLARFVMNLNYTWRACKCFRQHIACCCLRPHKEAVHEFSTQRKATRNCRYHWLCVCVCVCENEYKRACACICMQ